MPDRTKALPLHSRIADAAILWTFALLFEASVMFLRLLRRGKA